MSGGKKQTTTSNQTANTTTQLPAWMTQAGQDLYGKAVGSIPANAGQTYGGQMTAGASQNQQAASAMARANAGGWQGDLDAARAMTTAAAGAPAGSVSAQSVGPAQMRAARQSWADAGSTPQSTAASAGPVATYQAAGGGQAPSVTAGTVSSGEFGAAEAAKYMNPYQQQVQGNTLEQMRQQGEQDRQGLNDNVQAAKAFGGSRQAVLESELAKNQAQQRSDYIDSSNAAAFSDAQAAFERDRQARMAAETGNADRSLTAQTTNASFLDQLLGRMDSASQFNAGAQNAAAEANAGRQQQTSEANAGRQQQTNLANQDAANTALGANADRQQGASQFNAGSRNTVGAQNADRSLDASKTNASLYETMLQRLLNGGNQMGEIGTAASNLGTQDVRNLATTGAQDQATQQAGLDAQYQEYLRSRNEPLDMYSQLMAVLNGTPRDVTTSGTTNGTTTQKTSGSFLDTLMGLGQLGMSAYSTFSDPRLKKDVGLIERLKNGLGVYRFRYLWEKPSDDLHIGVMADEVARIVPEALGPVVDGFLTVNYLKLRGAFQ